MEAHPVKLDRLYRPIRVSDATPWSERVFKQLRHHTMWLWYFLKSQKKPPVLFVYPDLPSRRSSLYKMCQVLEWELTNMPRPQVLGILKFEDQTRKNSDLPSGIAHADLIHWNRNCRDIRKSTLDSFHQEIFGYGIGLDPTAHVGEMVKKSEENAKHDGQVILGPLAIHAIQKSSVYQRVIDNRNEEGSYFDLRVVWINGVFPVMYQKFKDEKVRFTNETTSAKLVKIHDWISQEQKKKIARLLKAMHVDFAEIDVLIDRSSQLIFVVDVNPTPWGPPAQLNPRDQQIAISLSAEALKQQIQSFRR